MTSLNSSNSTDSRPQLEPRLRRALRRYQVIAYFVGVWLLLLCVAMWMKYVAHSDEMMGIVGRVHGFGYMIYLVLAFDLTRQAGWNLKRTIGVLLAGTVPFLSFVVERIVTRKVREQNESPGDQAVA